MAFVKLIARTTLLLLLSCAPGKLLADVVVVVSRDSPMTSLDNDQLSRIFMGHPHRLPNGDYAEPVDLIEGSRHRDEFYRKFLDMSASQMKAHWSRLIFTGRGRPPRQTTSIEKLKDYIAHRPNAIGYIDEDQIDDRVTRVEVKQP